MTLSQKQLMSVTNFIKYEHDQKLHIDFSNDVQGHFRMHKLNLVVVVVISKLIIKMFSFLSQHLKHL